MASTASKFDPQAPDRNDGDMGVDSSSVSNGATMADKEDEQHIDFLGIVAQAERISKDYAIRTIDQPLSRAYRAWQNQHAHGSKYLGAAYKGRSRLFMPKTRSAVRKNLATAAGALFSTDRVVNVTAEHEDDNIQRATAATMAEDLDMRLTRTTSKSGLPWFLTAMGACLDSQLTGVCVSKQFWEYEEVVDGYDEVEQPLFYADGVPIIDDMGNPILEIVEQPRYRVTKDRPMSELHPIENCGFDPAAPWYSPAQLGRWFYVRYPMGISDVKAMMESDDKRGNNEWLEVSDELLQKGRIDEDRTNNRRVREGGSDRYLDAKAPGDLDIVWIQENFVRIGGTDWHFWSVGRHGYLTDPRPVHEVYPEHGGERPYAMGYAQLDTHRIFPMSPVESWQPLQLELNDITNLRQDTLKRSIAPLTVVKRGKNVDLTQVRRRGQPDAILQVDNMDDVDFKQTPGPSGQSYTETSINNSMFDELAGVFSTSSVQSTRSLNETVGGMRLMAGAANSVSEFDLRVWVETWVEPTLRQILNLIRYHESDEKLVMIAGAKARAVKEFDYQPGVDDFERTEVTLRVNVGIGAADPMQKLAKLKAAMDMLAPVMPEFKSQGISINSEAIIEEVLGAAGFRDGRRFFNFDEEGQGQGPDPDLMKAMEDVKLEREKMQLDFREAMLEMKSEERRTSETNRTRVAIEQIKQAGNAQRQVRDIHNAREGRMESRRDRIMDILANRNGENGINVPANRAVQQMPMMDIQPSSNDAALNEIRQQMAAIANAVTRSHASLESSLARVAQQIAAPAEIVRDPVTGKPVGVRRGGQLQQIVRGQDGQIAGAVPIAPQGMN
jgi:hypothetical protein